MLALYGSPEKLLKHSIFFATACLMLLHPLNLLLTNALSAPLWNMPVQFGILILLKTSMLWNLFSVELPVGLPIVGGFLHLTVGVSLLTNASKHLSGLPFNSVTTTLLFVAFMIVSTTGIPYHLVNIFSCPKLPQGVTLYLSGL